MLCKILGHYVCRFSPLNDPVGVYIWVPCMRQALILALKYFKSSRLIFTIIQRRNMLDSYLVKSISYARVIFQAL